MRTDNTVKRTKSHGWPFAAIHGFLSAFYYAHTDPAAVGLHFVAVSSSQMTKWR